MEPVLKFVFLLFAVTSSLLPSIANSAPNTETYKTIEWVELLPKEDFEALSKPQENISEADDYSFEDQLSAEMSGAMSAAFDDDYQRALESTKVVDSFNQQKIRLAGYIVPLDFDDEMLVTEFFFVPYFGACLHLPPPPPNQIVHVTTPKGMSVYELYQPYWVSGTVTTKLIENDTATSAYTMTLEDYKVYGAEE